LSIALVNGSIVGQFEEDSPDIIERVADEVRDDESALFVVLSSDVGEQPTVNVSKAIVTALGSRRQNLGIRRSRVSYTPTLGSLSSASHS
jgi:predicted RNA-binding protein with PIN domain